MRSGVRLGIDVGKARVGIARSDFHGILATPVETVARAASGGADIARILSIAREIDAIEFIVGLPLSMSGGSTASTADAEEFAARCAQVFEHPVRMIDERLTTVSAQSALHKTGRTTKNSRSVIDQVAAVILLQHALDVERASGRPPGVVVDKTSRIS
ncbi:MULTISPECIES: Holliday junction resolvase RuvX [Subtercola]|uniref:Putative pre-16S rRNA nuclease n=1 Tax=Subtercola vilae TaxID=2056433 RepID=A0A4T2C5D7_9MICO|nr:MULTISPECIES: Holliday junction resolvase RuvX [Subtercola]MEA9985115.1 Holliday junction resolvase RuvX [Subtercola sp. RTI3]TIH37686.1 Holliday junction resolvase RuvX [Subtercola vilae]